MFTFDESGNPEATVGDLRSVIGRASSEIIIVCEDGNYNHCFVSTVTLCTHFALCESDGVRIFLTEEEARSYATGNDHSYAILNLKVPVLRLEITDHLNKKDQIPSIA